MEAKIIPRILEIHENQPTSELKLTGYYSFNIFGTKAETGKFEKIITNVSLASDPDMLRSISQTDSDKEIEVVWKGNDHTLITPRRISDS